MQKFIILGLLFSFSLFTFAAISEPESKILVQKETNSKVVLPALDLDFKEAIYLPLDVYASKGQKIDYSFEKAKSGHKVLFEKPPLTGSLINYLKETKKPTKARKKWVYKVKLLYC